MSSTDLEHQEQVCINGPYTYEGLRDGVVRGDGGVELLEPRTVPLGGPRAMNVRRTLPQRARSLVGAWCFIDFYGPDDLTEATPMRVPRHPHTGLATVSWLFDGRIDHMDSAGNWATVRPGEVVVMNAGSGITHSEYSTTDTTVLHGAQLWYAFPDQHRFVEPSLATHRTDPVQGPGWKARVFLGELLGQRSPVETYLPLTGAELRLDPGTVLELDVPSAHEHGLLRISGAVRLNGTLLPEDHLGVSETGATTLRIEALDEPVLALLLGGEPLGEQIVMWWNFVGRSHEEIVAFRDAYQTEMGFEAPAQDSPLNSHADTGSHAVGSERAARPDGSEHQVSVPSGALGDPVHGELRDALAGSQYADGRLFPQFGDFPPGQAAPLPAPALPSTRMKPRG
ncbi:pirin family protein [Nesterenkonia halotolerans]|uniref:Redox-sensitive bicupin YhaK (Pirin superfamily) n=1 Tax=Nesterenkonia halotolerans TaxID=225325 RepID=A0ABR9J7Q2_9MICC|nr:pirin family protein [Nesterenkonia halotolerans]MBE1515008.1 redox-sensitive bicupin YhaK (pirin superfamily) [Nesterenkonia halotolerans]